MQSVHTENPTEAMWKPPASEKGSGKAGSPEAGFDIPLSYPRFLSLSLGSLRVSEPSL